MRNILRGTGLTIGSSAILFYAIAISVQLRRKARPTLSRPPLGARDVGL